MHKSRSESEFEDLGYEAMPDPEQYRHYDNGVTVEIDQPAAAKPTKESSGWSNWVWGNYGEKDSVVDPKKGL